jgi:hypothetical protein
MSLQVGLERVFSGTIMACFDKKLGIRQKAVEKAVK